MERRTIGIGAAAALVGVGVAAAEAGLVGRSALADPVWLALGAFVAGYWGLYLHWARTRM
jgi:Zn-dependent protease with chaperone function